MSNTYGVRITGAADGLLDYDIMLKSYSGIHYSGLTSHLSFQLVREKDTITNILARPAGDIILLQNGLALYTATIIGHNLFTGSQSRTLSMTGAYFKNETSFAIITTTVESIKNEANGVRVFKIPYHIGFNPLDSIDYNNEIIQIDKVSPHLEANNTYTQLREKFT